VHNETVHRRDPLAAEGSIAGARVLRQIVAQLLRLVPGLSQSNRGLAALPLQLGAATVELTSFAHRGNAARRCDMSHRSLAAGVTQPAQGSPATYIELCRSSSLMKAPRGP